MREVEEGIKGSMWLDPKTVEVAVEDGVVPMRGEAALRGWLTGGFPHAFGV